MSVNDNKNVPGNSTPTGGAGGFMEYNFRDIEKKWQDWWKANKIYQVANPSPGSGQVPKPKYYVLDMFPYPSGAGLHVGHPLGYIASDIYARFKRLKGHNVLHPMGYDAFGLPAEQYAIDHGIHPAISTEANIKNFRSQLDKIGFSFDWEREVNTSKPEFYKWTQWIFLQLFGSFYNRKTNKADRISMLVEAFEKEGNVNHEIPNDKFQIPKQPLTTHHSPLTFTAEEWKSFDEKIKQDILMEYRLAYCGVGEVNWCEALGTVLANDEVINGVSERGGYPVVRKKLRQWYMRITEYADRLLEGLTRVDFSEAMKEMQTNWIGKSSGAEIDFRLTPHPSPAGEGNAGDPGTTGKFFKTADKKNWGILKDLSRENRKNKTEAEDVLWQVLRNNQLGHKVRRQHVIDGFIIDFVFLQRRLLIEVDGGYHNDEEQRRYDEARTEYLLANDYKVLRFTNEEVISNTDEIVKRISEELAKQSTESSNTPFSDRRRVGDEALKLKVYTTRPDTIFGVDFMVIAPEHELVKQITSEEQKAEVEKYLEYVNSRNERERMAEKKITGVFTGYYAINPFSGRAIPIWISEYVLAGYGTGAIMAVPCGDQRDFLFAKHFNIPITNIIGKDFNGEEANPTKDAILENSDFINGMVMKDAIDVVIDKIEEMGIGVRKVNYKMRDAAFSRQRYWGEPIPIIWKSGIAYPMDEKELPLELPHVDSYKPGPEGEGPLANIPEWYLIHDPSPHAEKGKAGAANVPKYKVHAPVQYELARRMRKDHTEAEKKLWEVLRGSKTGAKFRRQHPIESYIVDFISLQDKLIIEVDGGYHETEEQKKYDEERTKTLKEIGFDVIRFSNEDVLNNVYSVRDKIKSKLSLIPNPSPQAEKGESPLSTRGEGPGVRETTTMPGYAGSSWYFLRYMNPKNEKEFCDRKASDYWGQVDLYIGGTEHAVGHLLYSRMWTKVLFDLGYIGHDEPYKRLVNQGMIQGSSRFVYRYLQSAKSGHNQFPIFISKNILDELGSDNKNTQEKINKSFKLILGDNWIEDTNISWNELHVDVNIVDGIELNIEEFRKWRNGEYKDAILICEDDTLNTPFSTSGEGRGMRYICGSEVEKMSKSKFNTVNPDDLVYKYGADTFRMYEMFLGPVEMSKPWDTKGIEGVHRFLKKLWRLFYRESNSPSLGGGTGEALWNEEKATEAELKVLHRTIKKIEEDTERFSFNTGVSAFMIAVNELTDLKCHKKEILEPLLILLAPYAPHIAEELYFQLKGYKAPSVIASKAKQEGGLGEVSIFNATYPKLEEKYLVESSKEYPVSINGKMRTTIDMALGIPESEVEKIVLANEVVKKWLEGKQPKKIIYKEGKMVNVVV